MSAADVPLRYRRLRAPREDGAALIDPPVSEAPRLVAHNRSLADSWDRLSGLPLRAWRRSARRSLLSGGVVEDNEHWNALVNQPLVLCGHQPTLFHPGVWLKYFLLDRIAKQTLGVAVDLLIDNDIVRHAGIRVPTGNSQSPHLVEIPYDSPAEEMPFEERDMLDVDVFRSFRDRVQTAVASLRASAVAATPLLLDRLWDYAKEPLEKSGQDRFLLGQSIALARHRLEGDFGLKTNAESLSHVCRHTAFREFVDHLLGRWTEFHPLYNSALREYRTVNRIRNSVQPAPDLAKEGDWLEAPLWIWIQGERVRRRAFVRCRQGSWELTDRADVTLKSGGAHATSAGFLEIAPGTRRGAINLRPRAFITTMYARLILSDLFIHGIGGAKYDELTDALIRRFFGIEPPAYVTATATFRLPIGRPSVTDDEVRQIERRIRDVEQHPESFVDEFAGNRANELQNMALQKQELIAAGWQQKQKRAWHDQVTKCNERMTALLSEVRERLHAERERLLANLHNAELLGSREFSFVLFPAETLPRQLLDLCAASA